MGYSPWGHKESDMTEHAYYQRKYGLDDRAMFLKL